MTADVSIFCEDVMSLLGSVSENTFDGCLCDPPYHLIQASRRGSPRKNNPATPFGRTGGGERGFMGKVWDGGDIAFKTELWSEVLRALKPGAHLMAFGGTRTHHRLMCAIEDAGFEIRDCLMWLYGTGFPKSLNVGNGYGTALKPAWEPIILAMKPLDGTFAKNALDHGIAGLNIDASRIGNGVGRWPSNVLLDEESMAIFPDSEMPSSGVSGPIERRDESSQDSDNNGIGFKMKPGARRKDTGSVARFFYCAKASSAERGDYNTHPTVKPISLASYLARLILPPPGNRNLFVPFCGSGSEIIGALEAGWTEVLAVDSNPEYVAIAERRIGDKL